MCWHHRDMRKMSGGRCAEMWWWVGAWVRTVVTRGRVRLRLASVWELRCAMCVIPACALFSGTLLLQVLSVILDFIAAFPLKDFFDTLSLKIIHMIARW